MSESENPIPKIRHYFVDEAGDPSLFKKHGKSIVGQDGCSRYFILGMADVDEPDIVATELESLRQAGLVHDVDDTREAEYGVYYTQRKPLTVASRA